MHIKIVAVGKIGNNHPEYQLCNEYLKRISYKVTIHEVPNQRSNNIEGEEINKYIDKENFLVCLDEAGQDIDSNKFSKFLNNSSRINFIIGGATGLCPTLKSKANLLISFGKMTWPHKFVRFMLLEQIYRAQTITQGHPYHK